VDWIDRVLLHKSDVLVTLISDPFRGAECDTDHYLIIGKHENVNEQRRILVWKRLLSRS
jgi:hypothetical protein